MRPTQKYRLTIRATQDVIPAVLCKMMQDRLAQGERIPVQEVE